MEIKIVPCIYGAEVPLPEAVRGITSGKFVVTRAGETYYVAFPDTDGIQHVAAALYLIGRYDSEFVSAGFFYMTSTEDSAGRRSHAINDLSYTSHSCTRRFGVSITSLMTTEVEAVVKQKIAEFLNDARS